MPSKYFVLDAAETQVVNLSWELFWNNFTVTENGHVLGQIANQKALRQGETFALADGRSLSVRLRRVLMSEELEVLVDGQPLAGSSTHPQERFKQGLYTLLFLVSINVVLGLVAELGQVELLQTLGLGYGTALIGLFYLGLYGWAKLQLSSLAFYLAMGLLILDFVLAIGFSLNEGTSSSFTGGLFMRVILCTLLYKGAEGARQLRANAEDYSTTAV